MTTEMKIRSAIGRFHEVDVDALVVPLFEGDGTEDPFLRELDARSGGLLTKLLASGELRGKAGETAYLVPASEKLAARRLLLVGAGKREEVTLDTLRQVAGTAVRMLRQRNVRSLGIVRRTTLDLERAAQAVVEGVILGQFDPGTYKTREKEERQIEELVLIADGGKQEIEQGIERGSILAKATNFARNLVNEPASVLTPTEMAKRAHDMAGRYGLDITVLDENQMKELGMGAILGVAQGSDEPARLIVLRYIPPEDETEHTEIIALVGKGITFDSGGISLKTPEGMERMKYDMAGGAAVLGAMRAIAQLRPPLPVLGIVPATENMPSGRAQKPGDILRSMSGKTIEVLNTDAEGRLILADAVSYARRLGATRIIDVATLTGAVSVALGSVYAAILGTDQEFIDDLIAAGRDAGEKLWPLPLDREYREQLRSDIADVKNIGGKKAGTITGAYFIREFVEETPWAHLDIAGVAWLEESKPHLASGPTGFGVRTLATYVCRFAERRRP
jgi:leucyl aminopeptidase